MQIKQKKLIFEKIIGAFAWLSLFLAIVFATIALFASFSGEQNGKEIFGYKVLIVASDSMSKSPISDKEDIFFDAGDVIVIKIIDNPNVLKVGDVITFLSYNPGSMGKTLSHKIREIRYSDNGEIEGIVTYGINKGVNDIVEVKPEHLIGKYVFKIPKMGHLFSFLRTPRGFYLSILIPGVLLIIFFSIKVGKILGKQEYSKLYNEEIDLLKAKILSIEEKGGTIQIMQEDVNQNTEQSVEQNNEQAQQQNQQGQVASPIYQTISITYMPTPFSPPPVIYQTAPKQTVPVYQTITFAPMQSAPVCDVNQAISFQQPIICQTIGDSVPPMPAVNCQPVQTQQEVENASKEKSNTKESEEKVQTAVTEYDENIVGQIAEAEEIKNKWNIPEAQKNLLMKK